MSIGKLLSIASPALDAPPDDKTGAVAGGAELAALLAERNGFVAFENALHVLGTRGGGGYAGLLDWNRSTSWRALYEFPITAGICFAQDVYGTQFVIEPTGIVAFNPETGEISPMCGSLDEWAGMILSDHRYWTGWPSAHDWQTAHGALPPGHRLFPRTFFSAGGAYEVGNLYPARALDGMTRYARFANTIHGLPDGARIVWSDD